MSNTGHHDSHTPEELRQLWQTPRWFFNHWDRHHHFAADIAASEVNHLCDNYITEEMNVFAQDFSGLTGEYVWCNPPYRDITPWIELFCNNADIHGVGTIALLPADVSTKWFKLASETADEIVFITGGRLSFVRADTQEPVGGNTKGSVVVIYRPRDTYEMESVNPAISFMDRDYIKNMEGA